MTQWFDVDKEGLAQLLEQKGRSAAVLELIQKGITKEQDGEPLHVYRDLDELAGTWGDEEAEAFLDVVADFEHVDEKLWQ